MVTSEFLRKFLLLKQARLAPTTLASYRDIVERILTPYFGAMELEDISPLDVELFLSTILDAGAAPGTAKRIYAVFRSAMAKAVKLGLIRANPAGRDYVDPLPSGRREIKIFSAEEVQDILGALRSEPLRWQCFARAALDSGARRGELVALQWRDIRDGQLHIERSAYKLAGQPAATKPPKSGKGRAVYLTAETVRLLERLRRSQRRDCLQAGTGWNSEYYIFGDKGALLHPTTPTGWWRKFLRKNGFAHRPLHALRHTCATLLLANGVDIKTVSARLGHSSLEVTEIYLHLVTEADRKAAEIMEQIL